MEDSEGTVRQIGVFSEGINNLTVTSSCTSDLTCVALYSVLAPKLCVLRFVLRVCWRRMSSSRRSPRRSPMPVWRMMTPMCEGTAMDTLAPSAAALIRSDCANTSTHTPSSECQIYQSEPRVNSLKHHFNVFKWPFKNIWLNNECLIKVDGRMSALCFVFFFWLYCYWSFLFLVDRYDL